jgi:hypothetical protein
LEDIAMIRSRTVTLTVTAILSLGAGTGCPWRKEVIKIAPDGTVIMHLTYSATAEELERFDALPSPETGWEVSKTVEVEDDKEKHTLTATQTFASGEELPQTYAPYDDPGADLCLAFPTTLSIEEDADGVYYHFHRVYTPRRWAYVQYWKDRFIDDDIKKLGEKPPEELTADEKLQIVMAFAGIEAFKQLEFAKTALLESEPDLQPEYWLLARRALLDVYEEDNDYFRAVVELCEQAPEDEREECFSHETERILAEGYAAFTKSLREDAGFRAHQRAAFEWAYGRAERYFEITDELGAHNFGIEVEMPGKVIAHNGDDLDDVSGTDVVEWTFDGRAFRDRPYELMAISRVDREPKIEGEDTVDDCDR